MLGLHGFGPAIDSEQTVFGASRPGYKRKYVAAEQVDEWLAFMKNNDIERIVCLLTDSQLSYYRGLHGGLIGYYGDRFGAGNVLLAGIEDCHLSTPENVQSIMSFLDESDRQHSPTLVHCSGGSGRTGHVIAAWLVHARGYEAEAAIRAVMDAGRNPREAVQFKNATERELTNLLNSVRA